MDPLLIVAGHQGFGSGSVNTDAHIQNPFPAPNRASSS